MITALPREGGPGYPAFVTDPCAHPDAPRHYPADLYELVHRGTAGDTAYYRQACAGARRILELGCGYGRVLENLLDLGTPGLELTGIERDPEMLARARSRLEARAGTSVRVRLVVADMRAFALPEPDAPPARFDRILIPHSGVYCLPDPAACVACFRRCAHHLAPGGRLVLDAYAADVFHATADPGDHTDERLDPVVSVEHEGTRYDVFERSRWDRAAQTLDVTYEYIPRDGGACRVGRVLHHYLLQEQIEPLLAEAGLRLVSLDGDFRGGPPRPDADMWVVTAARMDGASRTRSTPADG